MRMVRKGNAFLLLAVFASVMLAPAALKASILDSELTELLKYQMDYASKRQEVASENVANANTPFYTAREVKEPHYNNKTKQMENKKLQMAVTSDRHMGNPGFRAAPFRVDDKKVLQVTPSGNSVDMEEEAVSMALAGHDYRLASQLYAKQNHWIRMVTDVNQ